MTPVQTPTPPDIGQILKRLASLAEQHKAAGRISHAQGVRSAIDLVKRERVAGRLQGSIASQAG